MTARQIAELVGGSLEGDGDVEITGGNSLDRAGGHDLSFAEGDSGEQAAMKSQAGALLIRPDVPAADSGAIIRVAQPRRAFAQALRAICPTRRPEPGVNPTAIVAESARIDPSATIGPGVVIGGEARVGEGTVVHAGSIVGDGSVLGNNCLVHAGVVLYPKVTVGDRVILHSGAVLGADGFGFALEEDHYEKFPQLGTVEIGNDVEIGANACVDRGALGPTVIGDGTKLDNMVHIGHSCRLGRHVVIAAQTGLSGGVIVEDYVVMGGQVGSGEGVHVGARAKVGGQAGLLPSKRYEGGQNYWGTPARRHREHLGRLALVNRIPKLIEKLDALARRVEELESK